MPIKLIPSNGQWRVQIKARNGKILFWSEHYRTKKGATNSIKALREVLEVENPLAGKDALDIAVELKGHE